MDFNYIVLTRKEYKRLKALSRAPSGLDAGPNESALMNNRLITHSRYGSHSPDAACPPSVISHITPEGKNYLLYRMHRRKDWWWTKGSTILSILLSLIAALTGIVSLIR